MKVTVKRDELARSLAALTRIVPSRNTNPILGCALLSAADGKLRIAVNDLEVEAEACVAAEVGAEGAVALPAKPLADIAGRLPEGGEVIIEATADGAQATVRCRRSRFQLPSLPPEDFPHLQGAASPVRFTLPAADAAVLFGKTAFAIAREEARYYLHGVYLHVLRGKLRGCATNGHQLALAEVALPPDAQSMPAVIVPEKTVREITRLATAGDLDVSVSRSIIEITCGSTRIISKLVDGTFPDYERVIPTGNDKRALTDGAEFAAALARVSALAAGHAVRLDFDSSRLTLAMQCGDKGSSEDAVEAEYDAPPLSIGFNSGYVAEILAALDADVVCLEMADPASPALFRAKGRDGLLAALMPMRV